MTKNIEFKVFSIISLVVLVLSLLAIFFFVKYLNRKSIIRTEQEKYIAATLKAPIEKQHGGNRVIRITDLDKETVERFAEDFKKLYSQDGDIVLMPTSIEEKDGNVLLSYPENIDYWQFSFWVNYLVFSEKTARHDAVGWYQTRDITNLSDSLNLSNTTLMLFVPDEDKEYDVVYLVNKDGTCFKQEFYFPENLRVLKDKIREYEDCP